MKNSTNLLGCSGWTGRRPGQHTQNKCAAHFLWLVILLIYSASGHLQIAFFRASPSPGSMDDAINLSVERKMYVGEYGEDTKNDNLFID